MKNKSIIFSFLALSIFSVHAMDLSLVSSSPKKVPSVRTFGDESRIQVFHHGKDFYIKENQNPELKCVHSYDVDPLLKKMNSEQLAQFQRAAGYIVAKRLSNGEYKLRARVNGVGGGILGAEVGFFAGKFAVHFVAHGAILIVGACTGPAAPATIAALECTFMPFIEATSNVAAIGTAIVVATATGPV